MHLNGVLNLQFKNEEIAEKAVMALNNRWYNGKSIGRRTYVCVYVRTEIIHMQLPFCGRATMRTSKQTILSHFPKSLSILLYSSLLIGHQHSAWAGK